MPTEEQLMRQWETELEFPWTRRDYVPPHQPLSELTGKFIGYIQVDKETGDLIIIPCDEDEG
jgi:hypothetical protein